MTNTAPWTTKLVAVLLSLILATSGALPFAGTQSAYADEIVSSSNVDESVESATAEDG